MLRRSSKRIDPVSNGDKKDIEMVKLLSDDQKFIFDVTEELLSFCFMIREHLFDEIMTDISNACAVLFDEEEKKKLYEVERQIKADENLARSIISNEVSQ